MALICSHAYLKLKSFFIGETLLPHITPVFKRLCKNQIHLRCESSCFGKIWFQAYEWGTLKKQSICVRKTSVFLSLTKFSVHPKDLTTYTALHLQRAPQKLLQEPRTTFFCISKLWKKWGKEERDVCAQEPVGTRSFYSSLTSNLMGFSSTWNFLH